MEVAGEVELEADDETDDEISAAVARGTDSIVCIIFLVKHLTKAWLLLRENLDRQWIGGWICILNPWLQLQWLSNGPSTRITPQYVLYWLLTTDLGGSPLYTNASLIAGLSISSHSSAETLTVSASVTSTWVKHAGFIIGSRIYLQTNVLCSSQLIGSKNSRPL